jgi:lipopolysaccharide heptosyltransferase II
VNTGVIPRRRVLIMSTLGVGDILLGQPLFAAVAQRFADAHISILARTGPPVLLARRLGVADEIVEYVPKWPHRIYEAFTIGSWIRSQKFDTVLTTTGMNPYYSGIMALVSGARARVSERRGHIRWAWSATAPVVSGTHVVERNRAIGRLLGVEAALEPRFTPSAREKSIAADLLAPAGDTIAIIPGSNRHLAYKRWPVERFAQLLHVLSDRGYRLVLLGGPDEEALRYDFDRRAPGTAFVNLIGKTCIGSVAAILSECRLAVGNDGMLLHLAAAVGTRTVAIFGPSDPTLYRPYGTQHDVIKPDLPCAPCCDKAKDHCDHRRCLTELSVDSVLARVLSQLRGTRNQDKTGTENGP